MNLDYILHFRAKGMREFQVFTKGDIDHMKKWSDFITRKYPLASFKVEKIRR